MKLFNKIIIAALIFISAGAATYAQVMSRSFGGIRIATEYCSDSSGTLYAVHVIDFATGRPMRLTYIPGVSKLFLNFNVFTSRYLLGSYSPFGYECNGVWTDGILDAGPGTGTSL